MKISQLKREIERKKRVREILNGLKQEYESLKKDPNVMEYLRLHYIFEKNGDVLYKDDNRILDELVRNNNFDVEDKLYFCFGKDFLAHANKMGQFYLVKGDFYKYGISVAYYKNIYDEKDEYIIPLDETKDFENHHNVIFRKTNDPENEYYYLRKENILQLLKK